MSFEIVGTSEHLAHCIAERARTPEPLQRGGARASVLMWVIGEGRSKKPVCPRGFLIPVDPIAHVRAWVHGRSESKRITLFLHNVS